MRLSGNGEAPVALRDGPVYKRSLSGIVFRFGLRRLFILVLLRVQVTSSAYGTI